MRRDWNCHNPATRRACPRVRRGRGIVNAGRGHRNARISMREAARNTDSDSVSRRAKSRKKTVFKSTQSGWELKRMRMPLSMEIGVRDELFSSVFVVTPTAQTLNAFVPDRWQIESWRHFVPLHSRNSWFVHLLISAVSFMIVKSRFWFSRPYTIKKVVDHPGVFWFSLLSRELIWFYWNPG